jgi:hypothetical protein
MKIWWSRMKGTHVCKLTRLTKAGVDARRLARAKPMNAGNRFGIWVGGYGKAAENMNTHGSKELKSKNTMLYQNNANHTKHKLKKTNM